MTDLKEIYTQYFQDVYIFVLSLSRNEQIAEEITQETFFKALNKIDSFNGSCTLRVWLCQIAKNTYYTYLDRQKKFAPHIPDETAAGPDLASALVDKAENLRLHKILHRLDEPYKEVFTLRVFGELSFDHISQIFGRTESWARVTYHRAKHKIQDLFMEENNDEDTL